MTVYAIHAEGTDFVKIGFTKAANAKSRLRSMQSGNPYRLVVLAISPHSLDVWQENVLHRRLARWSVRGEWYLFTKTQREALIGLLKYQPDYVSFDYARLAERAIAAAGLDAGTDVFGDVAARASAPKEKK